MPMSYKGLLEDMMANSVPPDEIEVAKVNKPLNTGFIQRNPTPSEETQPTQPEYDPTALATQWMQIIRTSSNDIRKKAEARRAQLEANTPVEEAPRTKTIIVPADEGSDSSESLSRPSMFPEYGDYGDVDNLPPFTLPTSAEKAEVVSLARTAAAEFNIPESLYLRLVNQESGFNPKARSSAGAIGPSQLMPGTARQLGVNPHNTAQNVRGGARYLREQYDTFGSWPLALAAYNAGPGAVQKHGGIPPYKETRNYVSRILGR